LLCTRIGAPGLRAGRADFFLRRAHDRCRRGTGRRDTERGCV